MFRTSESAQSGRGSTYPQKRVDVDSSITRDDVSFTDDRAVNIVPCSVSDPPETFCNSDSCTVSTQNESPQPVDSLSAEHYNLAKLGDTLPHVLCGIKCPEKQAAQTRMLESRLTGQQRSSSACTSGKNRKQLKRSHTTVIQILDNTKDLSVKAIKVSQQTTSGKCLGNQIVHPSTEHQSPSEQNNMSERHARISENSESSIQSSGSKGEQDEIVGMPDLPGCVKQCW